MTAASHRLRVGRRSIIGQTYHIRFGVEGRQALFSELESARAVMCTLQHEDASGRACSRCVMIMPDHVHWVVTLRDGSLSTLVSTIKRFSSVRSRSKIHWQSGYFDRAVRGDDDFNSTVRYVLDNPVRAGLVDQLIAYPHWHVAADLEEAFF